MLRKRTSLIVLKGKFEGGKTGLSPIVTAVRSHFSNSSQGNGGDCFPLFILKGNFEGGYKGDRP
ncbi:hypothetical protein [Cylindrospermopsis raciborskii]|uniref:hypothetical protein n=1 Tax=Cylindrospermopsis raciborskii TaxID=77022 RepID=UPI00128FAB12|nr:hypothetical protein [Cylindrospermopsis raciborskii]